MKETYFFKELNFGGSLSALLHSYVTETPLLIAEPEMPFVLSDVPSHWDLDFLGFSSQLTLKKTQVWDRVCFLLSMGGYVLFPNNIQNIRQETNSFVISTIGNKRVEVKYDKINMFEGDKTDHCWVYDWFDVRSGCTHTHNTIVDYDDDFINELMFHPSRRRDVPKRFKDVVSLSYLPTHKVDHVDYSEGMARLKTMAMMKEAGIRGTKNGYDKKGKQLHYALKIEHSHREIKEEKKTQQSIEDILKIPKKQNGVLWNLTQKLMMKRDTSTLRELSQSAAKS
jgi:hypothetical protein